MAARRKVYVEGVPFTEVSLTDGSSIRLYDTSGPGSDPAAGLPPLRRGLDPRPGRRRGVRRPAPHCHATTAGPPAAEAT